MTKFEDVTRALADQRKTHFLTCKPSELILLALEDLEKVEKMKGVYRVDMSEWHRPGEDGPCYVCLAGSVLAMSYGAPTSMDYLSSPRPPENAEDRIGALNSFRMGDIVEGLLEMGITDESVLNEVTPSHYVPLYEQNRRGFKSGLRWIARHLGERGL